MAKRVDGRRRYTRLAGIVAMTLGLAAAPANAWTLPDGATIPMGQTAGKPDGPTYCPLGSALRGLQVSMDANGQFVNQIRGLCAGPSIGIENIFIGTQADDGIIVPDASLCDTANVVGARGTVSSLGGRIAGLSAICIGGPGTRASDAKFIGRRYGKEMTTQSAIACGPGKLAKGLFGWTNPTGQLTGFTFICASQGGTVMSGSSFVGDWSVTASDGTTFPMTLLANEGTVSGTYDQSNRRGRIENGVAQDGTLYFNWTLTGPLKGKGTGTFHLDDANHISGTWVWSNGAFRGTWNGTRQ